MYYVFHLVFPAIVALATIATNGHAERSLTWLDKLLDNFGNLYLLYSLPHLVWASVTSYFDVSKDTTIGGFIGAHLLLVGVALLTALSNQPEAANGWFFYLFGAPFTIAAGALAGRKISQWRTKRQLNPPIKQDTKGVL